MLTIEPFDFSDEHYMLMYTIDLAAFPDQPMSMDQWKHIDQSRDPKFPFQRELVRRDGQVVAYGDYGQLPWAYHPQKYSIHLFIHPDHDAPDIRPAYYDHVMAQLADIDLIAVQTAMFSHWAGHAEYVQANDFREVMREQSSLLDLATFDPGAFQAVLDRVAAAGVCIVPLTVYQQIDADWQRTMYDLDWELVLDIPSAGNQQPTPFDAWCELSLDGPSYDPDGWFVALDGDRAIGISRGCINAEDATRFDNSLTGVVRSHRRRGIATALKVHLLNYARERGAATIMTFNEARNPMYQLNLKLGFQPKPAWITLEKSLVESGLSAQEEKS